MVVVVVVTVFDSVSRAGFRTADPRGVGSGVRESRAQLSLVVRAVGELPAGVREEGRPARHR